MYLTKNNKHARTTKYVRILIFIILISVFVCACQSADNNSNFNVAQQSVEARPTQKNDELKWTWCIKPDKYSDLYFIDNDLIAVT